MNDKLGFLYQRQEQLYETHQSVEDSLKKQKTIIYFEALIMNILLLMNFSPSELSILGQKISSAEFSKIVLVFPFFLTYQYIYYRLSRIDLKMLNFQYIAICKEIEAIIKIDLIDIYNKNPYISKRGKRYSAAYQDKAVKTSVSIIKTITWLPFLFVYYLGLTRGYKMLSVSTNTLVPYIYDVLIVACLLLILFSRVVGELAYSKENEKKKKE